MKIYRVSIVLFKGSTIYFEFYEKEIDAIKRKQELQNTLPNAIYDIDGVYLPIKNPKKILNKKHSIAKIVKKAISD